LIPRLDAFACIRSGDIDNLVNRLHVAREKCEFVPFPTPELTDPPDITDGDYVYAGGSSYRDWPTLIEAVALSGCRAIFSAPHTLNIPATAKDSITVLPHQSPKDGRQRMARAAVAVVLLLETHRPNGPLILLDAMAMGKAVVTTLVNGTRDYVTDETAMLVPPADPHATANAIRQLMADPALRQRLGSAAAAHVRRQFTMSRTMAGIISLCERTLDQIAR
jgi:glycosyltransferase involved in cell wall biosynthesis